MLSQSGLLEAILSFVGGQSNHGVFPTLQLTLINVKVVAEMTRELCALPSGAFHLSDAELAMPVPAWGLPHARISLAEH